MAFFFSLAEGPVSNEFFRNSRSAQQLCQAMQLNFEWVHVLLELSFFRIIQAADV